MLARLLAQDPSAQLRRVPGYVLAAPAGALDLTPEELKRWVGYAVLTELGLRRAHEFLQRLARDPECARELLRQLTFALDGQLRRALPDVEAFDDVACWISATDGRVRAAWRDTQDGPLDPRSSVLITPEARDEATEWWERTSRGVDVTAARNVIKDHPLDLHLLDRALPPVFEGVYLSPPMTAHVPK